MFLTQRRSASPAPVRAMAPARQGEHHNRFLKALEPDLARRLSEHLERVHVPANAVLYDEAAPNRFIFFPETCVISLMSTVEDGATLAVGMLGVDTVMLVPPARSRFTESLRMVAHIPGTAERIGAEAFRAIAETSRPLQAAILQEAQAFAMHVAHVAACSVLHSVRQRCIRLLLMIDDRLTGDTFQLTHDALASMIGARRAGVTGVMQSLQDAGFISYRRAQIRIINPEALKSVACFCAGILQPSEPIRPSYVNNTTVNWLSVPVRFTE